MYGSELVPPLCSLGTVSLGNRGIKIVPRPSPLQFPAGVGIALLLSSEAVEALAPDWGCRGGLGEGGQSYWDWDGRCLGQPVGSEGGEL